MGFADRRSGQYRPSVSAHTRRFTLRVPALYVPPYPPRPTTKASSLALLWTAPRNLVAAWPDFTFEMHSFSFKVLRQSIHVLSTPDAVKQIFVDEGARYEKKTPEQQAALRPLIGDGLFISDGPTWQTRRRVVSPATHISKLPELTPAITAGAAAQCADWAQRAGEEIDALATMAELTASIIAAAIFGQELARSSTRELIAAFGVYQSLIRYIDLVSMFGLPGFARGVQGPSVHRAARKIHAILDELLEGTIEAGATDECSLLRSMREAVASGDAPAMDKTAFRNEAAVLFMAGHETTANTLAWAWFLLSQDPATEARLHAEVDAVLGDAPAGFADYKSLPFTRAIIEETLRLYPPVPLQGRQVNEDGRIGGKHIKKGDTIILNAWIMHRHRKLWPDPDAFLPERFLPNGGAPPSRYAYVPFSIGQRVCTGAQFGLLEATLCLATLSRKFRLRLRPGWSVMPTCRLSLRPGRMLPMTIEKRAA